MTSQTHRALITTMIVFWAFLVLSACFDTPVASTREKLELDQVSIDWAGYGEEKLSTVVITGRLVCDARESTSPTPISGASMAVFCAMSGKAKKLWARGSTDGYGEFLIDLPSHLHAIPNLENKCLVKVMRLPKSSPCRHAITRKHEALKLASAVQGIRTYSTHNIHLRN